jgi:predicted AlkP superfamily phosphohydrolase/phosphomutase
VLADPVQIDPRDAYFPMSSPGSLGGELWRLDGPFETMGWQEQTFALNDRFQSDAGFLRDMLQDLDRGTVTLLREMRRIREGHAKTPRLVFYTFTATDRACHCFWRYRDPAHPAHQSDAELAGTDPILTVFQRFDAIVGRIRAELEEGDTLLVASDHGFQTWRWGVHVNQWLVDNGYMTLRHDAGRKQLDQLFLFASPEEAVDWSKTRAFALGLGQIYINLRGRDKTGIVEVADKRALMLELKQKLEALKNPYLTGDENDGVGPKAIRSVKILEDVYRFGPQGAPKHVPDLQLGFEKGYRISWQTALLGGMGRSGHVFERNTVPWSGDHCSTDRELVPGVLFSNRRIEPAEADAPHTVRDIAATVMKHFGIDLGPLEGESKPLPFEDE